MATNVMTDRPSRAEDVRRYPSAGPWYDHYRGEIIGVDLVMVTLAISITYLARFGDSLAFTVGGTGVPYAVVGIFIGTLLIGSLGASESRQRRVLGSGLEEYRRVVTACFAAFGGVAIGSYLLNASLSRVFFLMTLPLAVVLILVGRWLMRHRLQGLRANGHALTPTLLVGTRDEVGAVVRDMSRRREAGYLPVAVSLVDENGNAAGKEDPLVDLGQVPIEDIRHFVANGRA